MKVAVVLSDVGQFRVDELVYVLMSDDVRKVVAP